MADANFQSGPELEAALLRGSIWEALNEIDAEIHCACLEIQGDPAEYLRKLKAILKEFA